MAKIDWRAVADSLEVEAVKCAANSRNQQLLMVGHILAALSLALHEGLKAAEKPPTG